MAVTTININEFLPKKLDGEIVTAEDWNKLVLLFQTINDNANALLDVMQGVDTNKASIAALAVGAVPDGSIGTAQLEKAGSTKAVYQLTEDTTPKSGTTYYTLTSDAENQNGTPTYTPCENLTAFNPYVEYYVLNTIPTVAAVSDPNAIANKLIDNSKIKDNTLVGSLFADLVLGSLLNDKCTVYTNKVVSGKFNESDSDFSNASATRTHTIKLDKAHKALLVIGPNAISLFTADTSKPDIHIGLTAVDGSTNKTQKLYIKSLVGNAKQGVLQTNQPNAPLNKGYVQGAPYGLIEGGYVCLDRAYYTLSDRTLNLTFKRAGYSTSDFYKNVSFSYKYGHLIIGL